MEAGSFANPALDLDMAAVLTYDFMDHGQSQPCSLVFAVLMLGGEERIEDVLQMVGQNPSARVGDFHLQPCLLGPFPEVIRANGSRPGAVSDGLHGVEKQIEQHLFDLLTIEPNGRKIAPQMLHDLDRPPFGPHPDQVETRFDYLIDVLRRQRGTRGSAIGEYLVHQAFNPTDILGRDAAKPYDEIRVGLPLRCKLHEGLDGREWIPDLMSEPANDNLQGPEAVGPPHHHL